MIKKALYSLVLVIITILSCNSVLAEFGRIYTGDEYQKIIGRGFDVSWFTKDKPYNKQTLIDIKARGFHNVRIRINSKEYYTRAHFEVIAKIVDDCIEVGIVPIVSYVNKSDDNFNATAAAEEAYIAWWSLMAEVMQDKSSTLAFGTFNELKRNNKIANPSTTYKRWTNRMKEAVRVFTPERIIILGAPEKSPDSLEKIEPDCYQLNDGSPDPYIMAEWHVYAGGPTQFETGRSQNWYGDGSIEGKDNVDNWILQGYRWSKDTGVPTWFGAWFPWDNKQGEMEDEEAQAFATYFLEALSLKGIPWSVNSLENYYDATTNTWNETATFNADREYNIPPIVDIYATIGDFGNGIATLSNIFYHNVDTETNVLNIYPNPTNGLLSLNLKNTGFNATLLSVINTSGNTIETINIDNVKTHIDFSNLNSGIYFLILKNSMQTFNEKLIIQK